MVKFEIQVVYEYDNMEVIFHISLLCMFYFTPFILLFLSVCPYPPERWNGFDSFIIALDDGVDVSVPLLTDGAAVSVTENTTITVYDIRPIKEFLVHLSFEVEGGVTSVRVIIKDHLGNVVYDQFWVSTVILMGITISRLLWI